MHHELELVKAALLYADDVEVLSLGNQLIREINQFTAGDPQSLYDLLGSLPDETLQAMGAHEDIELYRQMLAMIPTMDPDALRAMASIDPSMAQLSEFADVLDTTREQAKSSMAEMKALTEQMRIDSGVAEIQRALDSKLLKFNDNIDLGGENDSVIQSFMHELKRYLQDPTKFVLLDATVASLAKSMIDEGLVQAPARSLSNATEAVLGAGFIARLPAFTDPPVDEIIDLRRDLDETLGRYRRRVSELRGEIQTGPFDEHVEAEVDSVFRNEVIPAITAIRLAMADHSLVRELLRTLGFTLTDFAKGVATPAAVGLISANVLDLGNAVASGLTGAAAVGQTVATATLARNQGKASAEAHDLYYLYEVERRLGC